MKTSADSTFAKWTVPECPFFIEYAPQVVDDIRLAVVDAFFSLPRGGVEIGGILLGSAATDCLTIVDSVPMECEHAFGPSFTLSPNDLTKLEKQIAGLAGGGNSRPVGWYHSHTRSGVFLSDADLEVYRRFFPEAWQVALVLRPHAFEPVRAAFFFREAGGSVHASASYQEFLLDPLPVQPLPVPPRTVPPAPPPAAMPRREPVPPAPVLETQAIREAPRPAEPAAPAPDPEPPQDEAIPVEPPRFLSEEPRGSRRWVALIGVLLGAAIGAAGYQTRERWWPQAVAMARKVAPSPPAAANRLGLNTTDAGGHLRIHWDRNAPAVRQGTGALLMIVDGRGSPQAKGLDAAQLQSGAFTYGRHTGQVDITLTVHQPGGVEVGESTAFTGVPPVSGAPPADPEARKKQDALAERNSKLQTDLNKEAARNKKLEKTLDELRLEMQKKRMENQIPDSEKK